MFDAPYKAKTTFNENGVCGACDWNREKNKIDWSEMERS